MGIRHWPISGQAEQFYSGGFGEPEEDLRRLLRQIARWSEHEQDRRLMIEMVSIFQAFDDTPGEETSWGATVIMVPREGGPVG